MRALTTLFLLGSLASSVAASELVWQFNNPAFSGIGYSSHVQSVYQTELGRKLALEAQRKADELEAEREAENTPMAKFIRNLEARIYNELARQITEELYSGVGDQVEGSFSFNGGSMSYTSDGDTIHLTVTDSSGNITVIEIPIGDFGWLE